MPRKSAFIMKWGPADQSIVVPSIVYIIVHNQVSGGERNRDSQSLSIWITEALIDNICHCLTLMNHYGIYTIYCCWSQKSE